MTLERFSQIALGGMRFDLSVILYLNSLFILLLIIPFRFKFRPAYLRVVKWIYFIVNSIGLTANIMDIAYYPFTMRRTTLSLFYEFENETNISLILFQSLFDHWKLVVIYILIIIIMVKAYNFPVVTGPQIKSKIHFYLGGFVLMLVITGLTVVGMRGGVGTRVFPISIDNAAQYAPETKDITLVLNTPFSFLRTLGIPVIVKANYFETQEEVEKIFNPIQIPVNTSPFKPMNVVIFILESFSMEFIGSYNNLGTANYKSLTPFLDSLIGNSKAFKYSFASGTKSIEAMPSVVCSIPSIEIPYLSSHFSGNKINSLPSLLREKGYYSAFFHGAPNGSMGFQAFANTCSFDDYFGKDEYDDITDYDGIWGIWDDKFFQFFADKLNTFKEPFYANLFSVSSHHPFNIPKEFKAKFPEGELPIYKCISYTDYSLKIFFDKVSKMPWYNNTLFVFTADHAAGETQMPKYNTDWGHFAIPIFFYKPGEKWQGIEPEIIQQTDIMPTILGQLNYDKPYLSFGRDIFDNTNKTHCAFNYLNHNYQLFRGNYLLKFDGKKTTGLYDFKNDELLRTNLANTLPDTVRSMSRYLKALIQVYNGRMVDNNLVP